MEKQKKATAREMVGRWDWLLVALVAPLLLFPEASRAWTLLVVPLVLAVQWWSWNSPLPLTPLNPAILLLALMTGVSVFVTPDLAESLGKISGMILGIMVYFTVARYTKWRKGWNGSLALWSFMGIGVAVAGFIGTRWFTAKVTSLNAITKLLPVRISGLPGADAGIHPNELAGTLLWMIPVILMAGVVFVRYPRWFASRSGRGKPLTHLMTGWGILLLISLLVTIILMVLTQSRSGYLALMLTGIVLAVALARGRMRWVVAGIFVAFGFVGIILVTQVKTLPGLSQLQKLLPVSDAAFSLNTLSEREEIWTRAVWAIQDMPLTGLGMNIFRKAIHLIYPTFQLSADFDIGHAHNEMLQAALDLGLPGMIGLVALYFGACGMLVSVIRSGGAIRLLGFGLFGGLFAHFVFGITDTISFGAKPGFLLWWLLGMVFGLYNQSRPA